MTSALRNAFEYELFQKLSSSTNKKLILDRAFSIYDNNKTGFVNRDGWQLTFKNLGLNNFSDNDLDTLFYIYDTNDSGLVNYLLFSEYFSKLQFNINQPNINNNINYNKEENKNSNYNINYSNSYNIKEQNLNTININNQTNENINYKYSQNSNYENPQNNNFSNSSTLEINQFNPDNYIQYDYKFKDNNSYIQQYSMDNQLMHPNQYRIKVWEKGESEGVRRYLQSLVQLLQYEINSNSMIYSYLSILLKNKQDPITGTITFEDFVSCLNEAKINYSKINIKDFYRILDIYNHNKVSIVEILRLLRGYLSDIRRKVIIEVFAYLDSERKNYVDIEKLKRLFNPNNHPEVISGKKTADEIYKEFMFSLNNFNIFKGLKDKMSFDDFLEFFTGISATFASDSIFNNMISNIFISQNLYEKKFDNFKDNSSNSQNIIQETNLNENNNLSSKNKYWLPRQNPITKLRNYILSLGKKGLFEIERNFYNSDIGRTGKVDYKIFENICYNYSLNKEEVEELENIFDKYQTKMIDYDLVIKSLVDNMPENRADLVKKIFISLRPDVNGYVKIKDILNDYNYERDPDVISGRKNKDMVKSELKYYLDIFKEYGFVKNKAAMDLMNFGEFIHFYNQISICISKDEEFEDLIKNVWGIEPDKNKVYFGLKEYYHY